MGSLDGLRGVAALSVAIFHFFFAFVPDLIPGQVPSTWWGSDTPFGVLYNGAFAVEVFFVALGFVSSVVVDKPTLAAIRRVRHLVSY